MVRNSQEYQRNWDREHLTKIEVKYNNEFVQDFRKACKALNIKQSRAIRWLMERIIKKAEEQEKNE